MFANLFLGTNAQVKAQNRKADYTDLNFAIFITYFISIPKWDSTMTLWCLNIRDVVGFAIVSTNICLHELCVRCSPRLPLLLMSCFLLLAFPLKPVILPCHERSKCSCHTPPPKNESCDMRGFDWHMYIHWAQVA